MNCLKTVKKNYATTGKLLKLTQKTFNNLLVKHMTAHALRGRRHHTEFQQWFVPEYEHGRGRQNSS